MNFCKIIGSELTTFCEECREWRLLYELRYYQGGKADNEWCITECLQSQEKRNRILGEIDNLIETSEAFKNCILEYQHCE